MSRRKSVMRAVFAAIVVGVCATLVKFGWNAFHYPYRYEHAASMAEAKSRRTFVCQLFPEKRQIPWNGDTIEISEAWVELESEEKHFMVWWKYYQPLAKQIVSVNLNRDVSHLSGFHAVTFGIQQARHEGFSPMVQETVPEKGSRYWCSIDGPDAASALALVIFRHNYSERYLTIALRREGI